MYTSSNIMAKQKLAAPLGASLIVLSSVFYASYGIWTTLMGDAFGGYMASGLRSSIVVIILLCIAYFAKKFEPLQLRRAWPYILGIFATSMIVWGPLYYAILHAGIGISLTVSYACIVIGMLFFGWLFSGERLTRSKLLSAGFGIIGLGLIYLPSIHSIGWLALGAAVMSGFGAALNTVCVKLIPYNATQSITVGWTVSAPANLLMAFLLGESAPTFGFDAVWGYLVLFAVASVVSSWTFTSGLKLIDAGIAGILGLLEIVFAVLFGILFFNEHPGPLVLAGACVIIVSAAIPYIQIWGAEALRLRRLKRLKRLRLASKRA